MSNIVVTVGHDIEKAAVTVEHGISKVATFCVVTEKVLQTAITEKTKLRSDFTVLLSKLEAIDADAVRVYAEKGFSPADDLSVFSAVRDLVDYFVSTIKPDIVRVYGEIEADAKPA